MLTALGLMLTSCMPERTDREEVGVVDGVPFYRLRVERLADMNIPRAAHNLMVVGDQLVAIGGHTTGFIPVASAEWFDGTAWQTVDMTYPHDGGFATALSDGTILVGGGSGESFGIGQSWGVETYHPDTHVFEPIGILNRKRAYPSALTMPGDTVFVAGNWYAEDDLEYYTTGGGAAFVKSLSEHRCRPYMFQCSEHNFLIYSATDTRGEHRTQTVDRRFGEAFNVPLLAEWRPCVVSGNYHPTDMAIGAYSYLIPCERRADKQAGILRLSGEDFTLLETDHPLPMTAPDGTGIKYSGLLLTDRPRRHAYLVGMDENKRLYLADIHYDAALDGGQAQVTLLQTDPLRADIPTFEPYMCLTPDGNLMLVGGLDMDNFHPVAATCRLRIHPEPEPSRADWPWWMAAILLLVVVLVWSLLTRKPAVVEGKKEEEEGESPDMMSRIVALMEKEELFRKKDLRLADLAERLGTNTTYISATINGQTGKSFPDFVTGYRIQYARDLMFSHPEMRLSDVSEECGFTSERSFFRNFKASTGQTPSEWKEAAIGQK